MLAQNKQNPIKDTPWFSHDTTLITLDIAAALFDGFMEQNKAIRLPKILLDTVVDDNYNKEDAFASLRQVLKSAIASHQRSVDWSVGALDLSFTGDRQKHHICIVDQIKMRRLEMYINDLRIEMDIQSIRPMREHSREFGARQFGSRRARYERDQTLLWFSRHVDPKDTAIMVNTHLPEYNTFTDMIAIVDSVLSEHQGKHSHNLMGLMKTLNARFL